MDEFLEQETVSLKLQFFVRKRSFLTKNCMLLDFQSVDSEESLRREDCRVHSSNYVFEQTLNTVMERSVKHDV